MALTLLEISRVAVFRWEHHRTVQNGHLPASHVWWHRRVRWGFTQKWGNGYLKKHHLLLKRINQWLLEVVDLDLKWPCLITPRIHHWLVRGMCGFFLANPSVGFGGHYRMSADICDQHIWDILRIFSRWRILLFLQNIHKEWGSQVTCSFLPSWHKVPDLFSGCMYFKDGLRLSENRVPQNIKATQHMFHTLICKRATLFISAFSA